jgi:DNA-binding transcriptional LysR family regulator
MDDDIEFKLISSEPMVVALPKNHRLAKRQFLRLRELREEFFILYPRATRFGLSTSVKQD